MFDFNSLTVKEIYDLAKRYDVPVTSRTSKSDAIALLEEHGIADKMAANGESIVNGDVVIPTMVDPDPFDCVLPSNSDTDAQTLPVVDEIALGDAEVPVDSAPSMVFLGSSKKVSPVTAPEEAEEAEEVETLSLKINLDVYSELLMKAKSLKMSLADYVESVLTRAVIPGNVLRSSSWKKDLKTHRKPKNKWVHTPTGFVPPAVRKVSTEE